MSNNHPTQDDPMDDEFELEPIDPDILAHQRRQAECQTNQAQAAVDETLIQRAEDPGDPITLEELKQFRFTRRHLMMVTALLAMIMAVCQLVGMGVGFFPHGRSGRFRRMVLHDAPPASPRSEGRTDASRPGDPP